MDSFLLYITAVLYFSVSASLFLYGLHCLTMLVLASLARTDAFEPQQRSWGNDWPVVTIQLPVYNEMYVAERVINAACAITYPPELLEIQVLDDSTDETTEIIRHIVSQHQLNGVNISHLHRTERTGYKAGALAEGTAVAEGQFLAIFDADFIPETDYLYQMLPYFQDDIAFVQARWGHINPNSSLLTRMQAVLLDAHFTIEQIARSRLGLGFNFNGTAGIWRKEALEDAGGWQADTLTEDVDLSYRTFMAGWRAAYINDVVVPAELPISAQGFRKQQYRWARGSLECAMKLLPQIWHSSLSNKQKIAATFHLTGYSVHLFLFVLILLYPILLSLESEMPGLIALFNLAYVFASTALIPPIFFALGQRHAGQHVRGKLLHILFITSAGAGLMVNTLWAATEILLKRHKPFERTAKFGITEVEERKPEQQTSWLRQKYHLTTDNIAWWEFTLAMIGYSTAVYAYLLNHWGITFYSAVFGTGLFYMSTLTFWQTWQLHREARNSAKSHTKQPKHVVEHS